MSVKLSSSSPLKLMSSYSPQSLQIFLDIATEAVLAAGAVLQTHWGKLEDIQEKGRPGDLVTEADKAAEVAVSRGFASPCA